ncbi:MAG: ubiquinone biosynthesis protein [Nitrosospira sp.]|nr:ubiquinone biosynthesis protein [Nitrosospira sp.]
MLAIDKINQLNHLLHKENSVCKRLQAFSGKTMRLCTPFFPDIFLTVQADGDLLFIKDDILADAIVTLTPSFLPRLFVHDKNFFRTINISGDNVFAEEFINISKNLYWNAEKSFGWIVGDILTNYAIRMSEKFTWWHNETIHNLQQSATEYWLEETELLTKFVHVLQFKEEIDAFQVDTERLEQRLDELDNRISVRSRLKNI